jgi:hypothetical protein
MNGMALDNAGDDIYNDIFLRSPLHHYIDDGRLTFYHLEARLSGLVPAYGIRKR